MNNEKYQYFNTRFNGDYFEIVKDKPKNETNFEYIKEEHLVTIRELVKESARGRQSDFQNILVSIISVICSDDFLHFLTSKIWVCDYDKLCENLVKISTVEEAEEMLDELKNELEKIKSFDVKFRLTKECKQFLKETVKTDSKDLENC